MRKVGIPCQSEITVEKKHVNNVRKSCQSERTLVSDRNLTLMNTPCLSESSLTGERNHIRNMGIPRHSERTLTGERNQIRNAGTIHKNERT